MKRKIKDYDSVGLKIDKFRHSKFEKEFQPPVSRSLTSENKNDLSLSFSDIDDSFHKKAKGISRNQSFKKHGGALLDHDGNHFGKGPKGYQRSDKLIYDDVCIYLKNNSSLDASQIEVNVRDGIVYLSGFAPNRKTKKMAEYESELVSGVVDVQNMIELERQ